MPQHLVSGYLPDDYDPSVESEATIEAIHALNREMIAAGVRKFACVWARQSRCVRSPMVKRSSPTDRTWRPRTMWAVFGYWKPQTWMRRWPGPASAPKQPAFEL